MTTPEFDRESNPELRRLLADYKDSITPNERVFQSNLRRVRVRIRSEEEESNSKKLIGQLLWGCLSRRVIVAGFVGVATVGLLMVALGQNGRMLARPSVWVQELSNLSPLHLGESDRFEGVDPAHRHRSRFLSPSTGGSAAAGNSMKNEEPTAPGRVDPAQEIFPPFAQAAPTSPDEMGELDESQGPESEQKNESLSKRELREKRKKKISKQSADAKKSQDKLELGEILAEAASLRAVNNLLRQKKFSSASKKIDAHLRRYATGKLREEALALRIDISCLHGKNEQTKKLTQRFLREFPSSAFAVRLNQGCKATSSGTTIRDVAKE